MAKIFRTIILTLIIAPVGLMAQGRQSLPYPLAEDMVLSRIEGEDITGWTYGEDPRWYSMAGALPLRATSFEWGKKKEDLTHALGEDNISFIEIFRIYYGTKPYLVVVKATEDDSYAYLQKSRQSDPPRPRKVIHSDRVKVIHLFITFLHKHRRGLAS